MNNTLITLTPNPIRILYYIAPIEIRIQFWSLNMELRKILEFNTLST